MFHHDDPTPSTDLPRAARLLLGGLIAYAALGKAARDLLPVLLPALAVGVSGAFVWLVWRVRRTIFSKGLVLGATILIPALGLLIPGGGAGVGGFATTLCTAWLIVLALRRKTFLRDQDPFPAWLVQRDPTLHGAATNPVFQAFLLRRQRDGFEAGKELRQLLLLAPAPLAIGGSFLLEEVTGQPSGLQMVLFYGGLIGLWFGRKAYRRFAGASPGLPTSLTEALRNHRQMQRAVFQELNGLPVSSRDWREALYLEARADTWTWAYGHAYLAGSMPAGLSIVLLSEALGESVWLWLFVFFALVPFSIWYASLAFDWALLRGIEKAENARDAAVAELMKATAGPSGGEVPSVTLYGLGPIVYATLVMMFGIALTKGGGAIHPSIPQFVPLIALPMFGVFAWTLHRDLKQHQAMTSLRVDFTPNDTIGVMGEAIARLAENEEGPKG